MKKVFRNILLAAGVVMLAASCKNAAKMAEAAETDEPAAAEEAPQAGTEETQQIDNE